MGNLLNHLRWTVVFGDFVPDSPDHEHRLSPVLKMIDLGFIYKTKTET